MLGSADSVARTALPAWEGPACVFGVDSGQKPLMRQSIAVVDRLRCGSCEMVLGGWSLFAAYFSTWRRCCSRLLVHSIQSSVVPRILVARRLSLDGMLFNRTSWQASTGGF